MVRVLVADDDAANRRLVERLLQRLGASPVVVEDGQEAVAAAAAEEFDLILIDFHMPRMTGVEATREILAAAGDVAPVIVGLTATAHDHEIQTCIDAGMAQVMGKPPRREDLEALLATVLG